MQSDDGRWRECPSAGRVSAECHLAGMMDHASHHRPVAVAALLVGCIVHKTPTTGQGAARLLQSASPVPYSGDPCQLFSVTDIETALGGTAKNISLGGLGDAYLRTDDGGVSDVVGDKGSSFYIPFDKGVSLDQKIQVYYALIPAALPKLIGHTPMVRNSVSIDACALLKRPTIENLVGARVISTHPFGLAPPQNTPQACTWTFNGGPLRTSTITVDITSRSQTVSAFIVGAFAEKRPLHNHDVGGEKLAGFSSPDNHQQWVFVDGVSIALQADLGSLESRSPLAPQDAWRSPPE